jgi:ABC-type ATPase involved in cell division
LTILGSLDQPTEGSAEVLGHEAVTEALEWVKLEDRANSRPSQLSGRQSQRLATARAIVRRPAIVLADEPPANLDAVNSRNILDTRAHPASAAVRNGGGTSMMTLTDGMT